MDLLLTHGYFLQEDASERKVMKPYPPLGILYISAYLKKLEIPVQVFDSTFKSTEQLGNFLGANRPAIVGIYSNLLTRTSVIDLIAECKKIGSRVVVGGPDPANYPSEYLRFGADVVVIGEAEETMAQLVPCLLDDDIQGLDEIRGLVFRNGSREIKTSPRRLISNLDDLPFPDRSAINLEEYIETWRAHHGKGAVSILTSRGCPYTCTWCSHSVFGHTYRSRSPENVADEVEEVLRHYNPDMLWYADDVFTMNRRWFFSYSGELKKRNLKIPFETISREDRLDEGIVKELAEMGCFRLWIGSESGSQRILDSMQRRTNAVRVRKMVRLLQDYGIEAGMFIMLGYVGETLEDIKATLDHVRRSLPDSLLTTVTYPIKGTPYYELVSDRIVSLKPWQKGSDRELRVRGRHCQAFYRFAERWLVSEYRREKLKRDGGGTGLNKLKNLVSSFLGRSGVRVTRRLAGDS